MARLKAVGYVRVSTEKQAQEGLGLKVQEQAIKGWAKDQGFALVKICTDNGLSGSLEDTERPGLTEALNLVAGGAASVLVVYTLDRLARKLHVQEAVLAKVWQAGARVFSVDSGEILQDDADDPMRTFVRQVMGAVAELERGMIRRRLRNGRKAKAEAGGFAYGSPPIGYRAEGGELVEDEDEQAIVARVRELVSQGKSLREMAKILTDEGYKPKRASIWHPETLRRLATRLR